MNSILEIKNITAEYSGTKIPLRALREVSLDFEKGETTAIVGESGCGKSTLALSILGLIFPYEGKITNGSINYSGVNLLTNSYKQWAGIRGKDISIVLQDPFSSLNPVLTIKKQMFETVRAHEPNITKNEVYSRIKISLDEVMLKDHERILSSYPHQLSGGQRQRIAIAMAIANRPKILIADEPTTSLDVTVQKEIMDLIDRLKLTLSLTVILITHNLPLAKQRAQKIAVMYAGKIVEFGPAAAIFSNPKHPYTVGLLNSIPKMNTAPSRDSMLEGQPPDMNKLPSGCKFHPRCPKIMDICKGQEPEMLDTKESCKVRCYLYK